MNYKVRFETEKNASMKMIVNSNTPSNAVRVVKRQFPDAFGFECNKFKEPNNE